MSDLALIAKVPGVKSAVLGNLDGAYLEGIRNPAGETTAAVMGFVSSSVMEAGESLGLGTLSSISMAGTAQACLVVIRAQSVIAALVEPARSLGAVEKAVETAFQEWT
jgi:predicted regulator of Ras-like GTPase activity (Roadblock/LC7/MglB family)